MSTGKVSASFNKALSRTSGIEDAKKAEAGSSSIPLPVGWNGTVVVTDMIADNNPEKSDGKGGKTGGEMFVKIEVAVINNAQDQGKKLSKKWLLANDTKGYTIKDKFEWMLNEMEGMGLPREIRTGYQEFEEVIAWWLDKDNPRTLYAEVELNAKNLKYKNLILRKLEEPVDMSSSMSPSPTNVPEVASNIESKSQLEVVKFLGKDYEVLEKNGQNLKLRSVSTGKIKESVHVTQLDD